MDYQKHYNALMDRAKTRSLSGYIERHHIIPRCMGGTDEINNIAELTAEEHYVAHQLLVKMYPNVSGLIHAALMMTANRPGNKLYGWLRRKVSQHAKQRVGSKNGRFGTFWASNIDQQVSKVVNELPDGWVKGRNAWKIKKKKPKSLRPKFKVSDEDLVAAIKSTKYISEALRKVGYTDKGKIYERVHRLIQEYNLDVTITKGRPRTSVKWTASV